MAEDTHQTTTLVLGGTGKTGRRVVQRLTAQGWPTRVGSRSGGAALRLGRPGDLGTCAAGCGPVYVSYYPDVAVPGASDAIASFADSPWGRAPGGWCCCRDGARRRPRHPRSG